MAIKSLVKTIQQVIIELKGVKTTDAALNVTNNLNASYSLIKYQLTCYTLLQENLFAILLL